MKKVSWRMTRVTTICSSVDSENPSNHASDEQPGPSGFSSKEIPQNCDPCEDDEERTLGLTVPPLVKKRGRPKGHGLTTIGLPAKRARKELLRYKKPCSFSKLHVSEKEKVILSWFVDEKVAERALKHNDLIEEEDVECKPERLPDSVLDENVDIHLARKHFTTEAWMLVQEVFKHKSVHMAWICHSCHHNLHFEQSIICDSCLLWFHFKCVGLVRQPKCKNWFCRSCTAKAK
ncbi:hypothetical protein GBAR_LOCUS20403 [Geodia barretti]|nr:hypothetical protein GBAR_LOCUS20403 [Geodia barretti]